MTWNMSAIKQGAAALACMITLAGQPIPGQAATIDPDLETAIREKAVERLRDPASAIFTFDVVRAYGTLGGKICGTVNARNRFGAYTGPKFILVGYVRQQGHYVVVMMDIHDYSLNDALSRSSACD